MFAKERINEIIDFLKRKHSATVTELAEKFEVSEVTIRKDLSNLEQSNLVERSFGGAIWIGHSISSEISNEVKMESKNKEKKDISLKAVEYVSEGDSIFLDAGSTNFTLLQPLTRFSNLTVLTNDIYIANKLSDYQNYRVIFTGGEISNVSKASTDSIASKVLSNFNVDVSFLGCDSFSMDSGVCTTSPDKAYLKQTAMRIANKNILLATSDKYYRRGLVKFSDMDKFDVIVTDSEYNHEDIHFLTNKFKEINTEFI